VELHAFVGDAVQKGQPLFTVHGKTQELCRKAAARILQNIRITAEQPVPAPLLYMVIS
jgi:thymidine phosphorylase